MKVIFLDIDGVMVTQRSHLELGFNHGVEGMTFDPDCVKNLKGILDATDAKLVISSTWRLRGISGMKDLFGHYGIQGIVGITPRMGRDLIRGQEIQQYIDDMNGTRRQVDDYVILDDDSDMGDLLPKLIRTQYTNGLDEQIKHQVVARLAG